MATVEIRFRRPAGRSAAREEVPGGIPTAVHLEKNTMTRISWSDRRTAVPTFPLNHPTSRRAPPDSSDSNQFFSTECGRRAVLEFRLGRSLSESTLARAVLQTQPRGNDIRPRRSGGRSSPHDENMNDWVRVLLRRRRADVFAAVILSYLLTWLVVRFQAASLSQCERFKEVFR